MAESTQNERPCTEFAPADIEDAIDACVRAAQGDLEARIIGVGDPDSELGRLFSAINRILDVSDAYVRETTAAMTACAASRFDRPIVRQGMLGAYDAGAKTINAAMQTMCRSDARIRDLERQRIAIADDFEARVLDSVGVVASAATQVEATAREIRDSAESSVDLVVRLDGRADDATRAVAEGSRRCDVVANASAEIDSVLRKIDAIASQTKLLALNASIEAARAGDAGRGFHVVATEVKDLATTTSSATQDVHAHIESLNEASQEARNSMDAIRSVIGGAGDALEDRAADEDVRRVVGAIRRSSGGVVDAAAQMTDASAELARLAESLRGDVSSFLDAVRAGV